ncbi:hypothetical protein KIN20_000560 [Parelaphostrongylus tenuis]|uniref:Uncharacterized protein n=1 Tax=Parelaphostrongylus tenuis TaxID=148309 RepID=A0AAD5MBF9_PARTN|nr:hypothetical protein KIN20_000560 [Parelaphostrongylus tenuis]
MVDRTIIHQRSSLPEPQPVQLKARKRTKKGTAIVLQTSADIKDELLDWKRIKQWRTGKRITAYVLRAIKKLFTNVNEELCKRVLRSIPEVNSVTADHHITNTDNEMTLRKFFAAENESESQTNHSK